MKDLSLLVSIIPQLMVSTLCGGLIGWERERKNKVAGIRTNILICVGSCIFTLASMYLGSIYKSDPGRIMSTIVTGIGFLGAGVIMRDHDKIIGLTTAAFIWVVSAIGILCGLGLIATPIFITVGLLVIIWFFGKYDKFLM
jgi:putative Mg2+ transporter-C (MgtC) family protein